MSAGDPRLPVVHRRPDHRQAPGDGPNDGADQSCGTAAAASTRVGGTGRRGSRTPARPPPSSPGRPPDPAGRRDLQNSREPPITATNATDLVTTPLMLICPGWSPGPTAAIVLT